MDWMMRLNEAMQYLEGHLTEEVDYGELGRISCCSSYHFQRMFAYMAGVTLSEYVRRRRMSLAAVDLQDGSTRILDVALKYGYSSPTAFNRAFQSVHGIAPSVARENGAALKSFPPISFRIMVKGAEEMNYRVEKKEAFRIVGVSQPLSHKLEENFQVVPQMWGKASTDGTIPKLAGLMEAPEMQESSRPAGLLGVSACGDEADWRYFIAVASDKPHDGTLEEMVIPAATWAIFPGEGTNRSIQELEQRIVTEWLPSSGYEYGNAPDIEVYLNPDPENAKYEVWIPVKKVEA